MARARRQPGDGEPACNPAPAPAAARLRGALFTLCLLLLSLYLPLAGLIYLDSWYEWNCDWHGRCERLGALKQRSIDNLTAFFLHREPLAAFWSDKESRHLTEVRGIYDTLAILAALALAGAAAGIGAARPRRAALINLACIASLLLLLPVFGWFWRHVFHELLFDNQLWRTDRGDITWYLTPRTLFRNAVIALVIGGVAINLAVLGAAGWLQRSVKNRKT